MNLQIPELNSLGQFQLRYLVADDETLLRQDIVLLLRQMKVPNEAITEAKNGAEALEIIQKAPPDVLLLDIRMPGISGLELLKRIGPSHPGMKTVIISGFAEFDYVKEAMACGAMNYLLKPLDDQVFFQTIGAVCTQIRSDKKQAMRRSLEDCFYRAFSSAKAPAYLSGGGTAEGPAFSLHVMLVNPRDSKYTPDEMLFNVSNILKRLSEPLDCFYYFQNRAIQNQIVMLCIHTAKCTFRHKIEFLLEEFYHILDAVPVTGVYTASCWESGMAWMLEAHQSCMESLLKRFCEGRRFVFQASSPSQSHWEQRAYPGKVSALLDLFVHAGSYQQDLVEQIFAPEHIQLLHDHEVKKIFSLLTTAHCGKAEYNDGEMVDYFNTLPELVGHINALNRFNERNAGDISAVIQDICEDIRSHYEQEISLTSLSEKYHVNPNYLSELFKEKTGVNFKDYLCEIRLSKAVQMLSETNMSIKNISYSVGYNSQGYFQKVFKRQYCCTPMEFRERGHF